MTLMTTTQASVSLLLSEKELEVARLREQALTSLEAKVSRARCRVSAHEQPISNLTLSARAASRQGTAACGCTQQGVLQYPHQVIESHMVRADAHGKDSTLGCVNLLTVCLQFHHLQQDYEYNLELLDGRDAELEQYDTQSAALKQELLAQEQLVAQLRSGLAHAGSGKFLTCQICRSASCTAFTGDYRVVTGHHHITLSYIVFLHHSIRLFEQCVKLMPV